MDLNIFATNKEDEVEGVWHDFGDARIKIARSQNKRYVEELRKMIEPNKFTINSNTKEGAEKLDEITTRAMAIGIITDWEGIKDAGEEIAYSHDNAYDMMRKYNDFRELVANLSDQANNYRLHVREDVEKK